MYSNFILFYISTFQVKNTFFKLEMCRKLYNRIKSIWIQMCSLLPDEQIMYSSVKSSSKTPSKTPSKVSSPLISVCSDDCNSIRKRRIESNDIILEDFLIIP